MPYYSDDNAVTLDELKARIVSTDLIPSRVSLLKDIDRNFAQLWENGIQNLAGLRSRLKQAKKIPAFSAETGIDTEYLTLLRREVESYFPKPFPVQSFGWLGSDIISRLEEGGLSTTRLLYEALDSPDRQSAVSERFKVDAAALATLFQYADLTRIQWVSPLSARMLHDAGYTGAGSVCCAEAAELYKSLDRINAQNGYFKGTIGLRDVRRLIHSASYLP
ncbi:MAG: DUF4332 domain-containing protein [Spirochaetota bacterium]